MDKVNLVIKAANPKVQDFKIECELDWSVKRLKAYISLNYPTRPLEQNMRLIYFGKLLQDHLELKDFIRRSSDMEIIHNVHLIYTQCNNDILNETATSRQSTPEMPKETPLTQRPKSTQSTHQHEEQYNQILSHLKQQYNLAGVSLQNQWNLTYIQHLALYYHMNAIYLHSLGFVNTSNVFATSHTTNEETLNQDEIEGEQARVEHQPNPIPQQVPNQEENENDWLSILHNVCSFVILFTIIYFYSSLTRFFCVFGVVMLLLMYHNGWFTLERRRNVLHQPQQAQQEDQQQQPRQEETLQQQQHEQQQQPNILMLIFRFIITFFTSLIPERPRIPN